MKLTKKQQDFADYYIELGNAEEAAIKAGYSKNYARASAYKLLANVGIKKYIDERMEQLTSKRIMSAQEILERLSLIANAKIKETVVVANAEGYSEVEKPPDFKVQIQAMKELLKRYPSNDKLLEQTLRKLTAEADIAEFKAAMIQSATDKSREKAEQAHLIALNNADDIKEIKANNKWAWGYMIGLGISIVIYFLTKF